MKPATLDQWWTPGARSFARLMLASILMGLASANAQPESGRAQRPGGPPELARPGISLLEPLRGLDLTRDQRAELREILEVHRDQFRELMDRLRDSRGALNRAIHADRLDREAIRDRANRLGELEGDLAMLRARVWRQVRRLLTPEQREQLEQRREARGERDADARERRRERNVEDPGPTDDPPEPSRRRRGGTDRLEPPVEDEPTPDKPTPERARRPRRPAPEE